MRDACPSGQYGLHAFDHTIVSDESDHVEECVQCGDKVFYKVIEKRIDNAKYRRDHERDFIQPTDARFERIYGNESVKLLQESIRGKIKANETKEAMRPMAQEYLKHLKSTSFMMP